jgi:hypothetical protein
MKKLSALFLFPLLILAASFYSPARPLSLQKALEEKKIEIEIVYTGKFPGKLIDLKVKNLTNKILNLELAPGTIFVPDSSGQQTLTTTEEEIFVLEKDEKKTFHISAYCTELHDKGSTTSSTFTVSNTKREKLQQLVTFLDSLNITEDNAIQHSVWCVTDSASVADVYLRDPKKFKVLRAYLCTLTGQKDTWYSTEKEITMDEERNIVTAPQEIKGNIAFESTEPVELQGFVKDSTGKIIITNEHKTNMPAGKIKFEFNLKIQGWAPGNYSVVYTNNGKEVINQAFSF